MVKLIRHKNQTRAQRGAERSGCTAEGQFVRGEGLQCRQRRRTAGLCVERNIQDGWRWYIDRFTEWSSKAVNQ